jgi:hypothetical protein
MKRFKIQQVTTPAVRSFRIKVDPFSMNDRLEFQ